MTDGHSKRGSRRRRTTRRLSRRPIRVPSDEVPRTEEDGDVDVDGAGVDGVDVDVDIEHGVDLDDDGAEETDDDVDVDIDMPGSDRPASQAPSYDDGPDSAPPAAVASEESVGSMEPDLDRYTDPNVDLAVAEESDEYAALPSTDGRPDAGASAEPAAVTPTVDQDRAGGGSFDDLSDTDEDEHHTDPHIDVAQVVDAVTAGAPSVDTDAAADGPDAGTSDVAQAGEIDDDGGEDEDNDKGEDDEERGTDPKIAVTRSEPPEYEEERTNPRIDMTAVVAAAHAPRAPMPAAEEPEEKTNPRIDVEAMAAREMALPSVIVSGAQFISEPPPVRKSQPPPEPQVPPTASVVPAHSSPPAAADPESDDELFEEASLDELAVDDEEPSVPKVMPPAPTDAQRSKGPPPPPPKSRGKRNKPPPPPAQTSTAPVAPVPKAAKKQPRQWWQGFFSDDYLQTVRPPTQRQVERQCDFLVGSLGLKPGMTVLDVGCGLGLHSVELARRGCLVVGIDISLPMITRAAEAAQEQGLQINFLHSDFREIELEGSFDAVICLGTTFGFFDDESNADVLRRLNRSLRPGGQMLLDIVNRDFVVGSQPNLVWFEGLGCVCMEESDFNFFTSRLFVKRTVMHEDGRQANAEYSLRLYSLHELGQLLQLRDFKVLEVSGQEATRGIFFGTSSQRIMIHCERRMYDRPPDGSTE